MPGTASRTSGQAAASRLSAQMRCWLASVVSPGASKSRAVVPRQLTTGALVIARLLLQASALRWWMSTPPATKPGSATIRRCSGRLVAIPSMRASASAPRSRDQRLLAGGAVDDDLGDQRVVVGRHAAARGGHVAVDADAGAARHLEAGDDARRGREGLGVLGVDPALEGMAAAADVGLREGQRLAPRHADAARGRCRCRSSSSVIGCSTCRRVFISMKEKAPSSNRNSKVPTPLVADLPAGLGAALADLRRPAPARGPAPAPPRAPSGGGAAASSRGCRARRRCRGGRPAPGSRHGGDESGTSRCRSRGCRRRAAPPRG